MYQSNIAVIKSQLSQLSKEHFLKEARYIKQQALMLPVGHQRYKYVQLYGWCRHYYQNRFCR